MTLPPPSPSSPVVPPDAQPLTSAAPGPASPVAFPLTWLMDHAAAPIQYRAITEVAKLPASITNRVESLPFTHRAALTLAMKQQPDGMWNHAMLSVPAAGAQHFEGIGTINAARRLLEYGWDKNSPPLSVARRALFRVLAEDQDPLYLYELGGKHAADAHLARRARNILREAAAATLAQAGYESDPRLRGAAARIIGRVAAYLRSPLAEKPFVRLGNQHVLAADAAPPSIYALVMLAHMPLFRSEHHSAMALLYAHLSQSLPRQESVQLCGNHVVAQPHLVLGDLLANRSVADHDVVLSITWLELMARLGFLHRSETWSKLYERFLADRDAEGVWHPHKGLAVPDTTNPFLWPTYPLGDPTSAGEQWTDVTFRLGLIGRLSGRTIELA